MASPGAARAYIEQLLGTLEKDESIFESRHVGMKAAEWLGLSDPAESKPVTHTGCPTPGDSCTRIPPSSGVSAHVRSSWLVRQLQERDAQLADLQEKLTQAKGPAATAGAHAASVAKTTSRPEPEQEPVRLLEAEKQYLTAKVAALQESQIGMQQQLQGRARTIAELEDTVQDAARELSGSRDAACHLGAKVERLQRREAEMMADLAQRDLAAAGLQDSLHRLSDKLTQMQTLQSDAQRAELSSQVRSAREELEGRMQVLQDECNAQLQHVKAELEAQLQAVCVERDEAQEAAAGAEAETHHLRKRLREAEDATQRVQRCGELRAGELKRLLQAELGRAAELQLALDRQEGACHRAQQVIIAAAKLSATGAQENTGLRRDLQQVLQNREAVEALRAQLKAAMALPNKRTPTAKKPGSRPGRPK